MTATSGAGAGAASRPEQAASDAEIIARSQQDGQAFAALFDRHAVPVHRYLTRRIGPGTADDLLGQTFLVAFEQRGSYDPARPDAGPWLYGIATNLLRRHHRDEARLYRALARVAAGAGSRGSGGSDADALADAVAERVDAGALSRQLAAALAGLKLPDRDVLLLFSWADLGYHEIALALNIPVGTVRSRLHRARVAVRAALGLPAPSLETS